MRDTFRALLAIKSLVLGVLILGLWGRSYFVGDQFRRGDAAQYIQLGSARGSVVITFGHDGQKTRLGGAWDYVASQAPEQMLAEAKLGNSPWNRVGFGFSKQRIHSPAPGLIVRIVVPHWLVFLLAIPSAVRWGMRRWLGDENPPARVLECPRCGQMFTQVPHTCPMCGQALAVGEFR